MYSYQSTGRNPKTMIALGVMIAVIVGLEAIGAVWWIVTLVALITLPAALDVLLNLKARLELDQDKLFWKNRSQEVTIPFPEIEKIRFDGRLDTSVRISVVLKDGRKLRLPYDAQPPHRELEAELKDRDIPTERHPFSLF